MQLITPHHFAEYELIDCGGFEKLESFGKHITCRPEPQALWDKALPQKEWDKLQHVKFVAVSSSSGKWNKTKEMPDQWFINYPMELFSILRHLDMAPMAKTGNWKTC